MIKSGLKREAAYFAGGILFGTAGLKLLGSRDAKRGYAHIAAAVIRVKDEIMKNVTAAREAYSDIIADAHDINANREKNAEVIIEDESEKI